VIDVPHIQAHVHGPDSRSVLDLDDSPTVLRDEEVAGSNPVTPTIIFDNKVISVECASIWNY